MLRGMKLYAIAGCPYAWRARIALQEKGLPFELVFYDRKNRPSELDAVSRDAASPTLFDGDDAVHESLVVLEYLEDRYPAVPLMPAEPAGRARTRIAIRKIDQTLMAAQGGLVRELFLKPEGERDAAAIEAARVKWREQLGKWNEALEGREYVTGDRFTLADVVLFTPIPTARRISGEEVPAELSHLRGWLDRMEGRPSMKLIESPVH